MTAYEEKVSYLLATNKQGESFRTIKPSLRSIHFEMDTLLSINIAYYKFIFKI